MRLPKVCPRRHSLRVTCHYPRKHRPFRAKWLYESHLDRDRRRRVQFNTKRWSESRLPAIAVIIRLSMRHPTTLLVFSQANANVKQMVKVTRQSLIRRMSVLKLKVKSLMWFRRRRQSMRESGNLQVVRLTQTQVLRMLDECLLRRKMANHLLLVQLSQKRVCLRCLPQLCHLVKSTRT